MRRNRICKEDAMLLYGETNRRTRGGSKQTMTRDERRHDASRLGGSKRTMTRDERRPDGSRPPMMPDGSRPPMMPDETRLDVTMNVLGSSGRILNTTRNSTLVDSRLKSYCFYQ
jgi:hypothetical protein